MPQSSPPPSRRSFRLAAALALAVTALVWGLRRWIGIETGDFSGTDLGAAIPVGFVGFIDDNLSYASWAMQAAQGKPLFADLYTAEPHAAALLNPIFLLYGAAASLAGAHVVDAMLWLSLAAVPVAVLAAFAVLAQSLNSQRLAALAVVIWIFAAGIGWLRKAIALPIGSDLISRDLHTLTTFVNFPYHTMALAWILGALALLLHIDRAIDAGRRPIGLLVVLIVASLLTTLARPYEMPMIALAWFFYALYRRGPRWRIGAALTHGAALLPVVVYQYWVSKQPVWADFAQASLATGSAYPHQFLVGFAFLWPLALVGIWRLRRDAAPPQARLLVVWFALMGVPMLFGHLGLAKLAGGAPLLFAALATPAMVWLWGRGRALRFALAGAALLSLPSTILVLLFWRAEGVRTVDGEVLALVNALPAETRILTDCETGRFIPALTGRRVWCGQWALTPQYKDKDRQATLLGLYASDHVVPGDAGQVPPLQPVGLQELTARDGLDVLLAPVDAPVWLSLRGPVTQVGERWRLTRLR
ncbi:MAG: hypothetical protein RIM84_01220 [Alphaproteobacteria bacterium]